MLMHGCAGFVVGVNGGTRNLKFLKLLARGLGALAPPLQILLQVLHPDFELLARARG